MEKSQINNVLRGVHSHLPSDGLAARRRVSFVEHGVNVALDRVLMPASSQVVLNAYFSSQGVPHDSLIHDFESVLGQPSRIVHGQEQQVGSTIIAWIEQ